MTPSYQTQLRKVNRAAIVALADSTSFVLSKYRGHFIIHGPNGYISERPHGDGFHHNFEPGYGTKNDWEEYLAGPPWMSFVDGTEDGFVMGDNFNPADKPIFMNILHLIGVKGPMEGSVEVILHIDFDHSKDVVVIKARPVSPAIELEEVLIEGTYTDRSDREAFENVAHRFRNVGLAKIGRRVTRAALEGKAVKPIRLCLPRSVYRQLGFEQGDEARSTFGSSLDRMRARQSQRD